jgi:hypothetical protein
MPAAYDSVPVALGMSSEVVIGVRKNVSTGTVELFAHISPRLANRIGEAWVVPSVAQLEAIRKLLEVKS